MIILASIISPPIVGVPFFFKWDSNYLRSVCPTFNRFKKGITIGPKIALIAKEIKTGITIS